MIDDLRHFKQDAFALLTEEQAAAVLLILLAVCLILDRLGVWA